MIITLGFYQEKSSIDAEKPEIIRIIGESKKRTGYWVSQEGKEYSDADLEDNFIRIELSNKNVKEKPLPSKLFEGLGEINLEEPQQYIQQTVSNIHPVQQIQELEKVIQQPIIKEIPINFDKAILEKLQIDRLNKINMEQYGEPLYKDKPVLKIELPVTLNYDIKKLQQTIDILSLDAEEIAIYIINEINITNIKELLITEFLKLLDTKNNNNIQIETKPIETKPIETKSIEQQLSEEMKDKIIEVYTNPETVQPKSISQEEMITEISNIDNYIKSIFK